MSVTPRHISRVELEQATPSLELLLKLSQRLGVTTDYLFTGRETAQADATSAIRAQPGLSAAAKRHLIGVLNELRSTS